MVRPPDTRAAALAAVVGAVLVVASACGTSGRVMRRPAPGATAPTTVTTPLASVTGPSFNTVSSAATNLFVLNSPAFTPGDTLPKTYTCDGAGQTPPLSWSNVPKGSVELVLVLTDPDARGFVHWMVAGIPASTSGIQPNELPASASLLANSAGAHKYTPPCPPKGQDHTYEFTLYALKVPSGLTANSNTEKAIAALDRANLKPAVLTADYARA
jgi:Raf kinase inhibitor-like YbhB/YbcL family protein